MSDKTYNRLKILQLILPDLLAAYGIIDSIFGWNGVTIAEKLAFIIASILGHILKESSDNYFSTRSIVNKIVPDTPVEEEKEVE